jgi:hypothetical protein
MTLEILPNRLSDQIHEELDARAYKATSGLGVGDKDTLGTTTAALLLTEIVSASAHRLDSRLGLLRNAVKIVDEKPELLELLNIAWQRKAFRDVRNLRPCFLYIPVANFNNVNDRLFEPQLRRFPHQRPVSS